MIPIDVPKGVWTHLIGNVWNSTGRSPWPPWLGILEFGIESRCGRANCLAEFGPNREVAIKGRDSAGSST
jgi:hypothetical protein